MNIANTAAARNNTINSISDKKTVLLLSEAFLGVAIIHYLLGNLADTEPANKILPPHNKPPSGSASVTRLFAVVCARYWRAKSTSFCQADTTILLYGLQFQTSKNRHLNSLSYHIHRIKSSKNHYKGWWLLGVQDLFLAIMRLCAASL